MFTCPVKEEAYRRLKVIRQRCNRVNAPNYQYYGGLGIRCEVSWEEFLPWYLANVPCDGGKWHISRIDHEKNYTLENMFVCKAGENISERNDRRGLPQSDLRKRVIADFGRVKIRFSSQSEAADFLGVSIGTVSLVTAGKVGRGKLYCTLRRA